jgi:hypothetical protein
LRNIILDDGPAVATLVLVGSRFRSQAAPSGIDLRETPFEVYKAVSQQIRDIFAEHTPIIEPLSLDEAYLDVTENLRDIPLARDVALAIRAKIKQETGLNASAGISYNRFLAKLASDHRKPNGQYVITPEMGPPFVEALPVGKFQRGPREPSRRLLLEAFWRGSVSPPCGPSSCRTDARRSLDCI